MRVCLPKYRFSAGVTARCAAGVISSRNYPTKLSSCETVVGAEIMVQAAWKVRSCHRRRDKNTKKRGESAHIVRYNCRTTQAAPAANAVVKPKSGDPLAIPL